MRPDRYLDVGIGVMGGYRAAQIVGRMVVLQLLFDTASDVAAAAKLADLPVLTSDPPVQIACRTLGVKLLAANETRQEFLPL